MIDFPRMLYHVVEEPFTVKNEEELKDHLDHGWSMTPIVFDEIKALKAKIAYHDAESNRLKEILSDMGEEMEEAPEVPEKFICDVCGQEAKSNAGLSAHKRAQHKIDQESVEV